MNKSDNVADQPTLLMVLEKSEHSAVREFASRLQAIESQRRQGLGVLVQEDFWLRDFANNIRFAGQMEVRELQMVANEFFRLNHEAANSSNEW